ncbi:MAG: class I SAM-dependent methyltransferase [Candidatus Bathyarchaeota archaeon]|nr:class I SAM-dependent methyltransferase [Candidatus Bathyarchaeota archaeon]
MITKNKDYLPTRRRIITLKRTVGEGSNVDPQNLPQSPQKLVEWFRHFFAYRYAKIHSQKKVVLDVGCGTGYGINHISNYANMATGMDIWKRGIHYCQSKYGDKNFFFIGSASSLPIKDSSIDLVVSFQVIEHIQPKRVDKYLKDIKRMLTKDGLLILTTPNKKLRILPLKKPWNTEHKKEYTTNELKKLLEKVFVDLKILGLFATKKPYMIEYNRIKQNPVSIYIKTPLLLLAKKYFSSSILKSLKTIFPKKNNKYQKQNKQNSLMSDITIDDFQVLEKNIDSCLDIYAICKKNQSNQFNNRSTQ